MAITYRITETAGNKSTHRSVGMLAFLKQFKFKKTGERVVGNGKKVIVGTVPEMLQSKIVSDLLATGDWMDVTSGNDWEILRRYLRTKPDYMIGMFEIQDGKVQFSGK